MQASLLVKLSSCSKPTLSRLAIKKHELMPFRILLKASQASCQLRRGGSKGLTHTALALSIHPCWVQSTNSRRGSPRCSVAAHKQRETAEGNRKPTKMTADGCHGAPGMASTGTGISTTREHRAQKLQPCRTARGLQRAD